MLYDALIVFSLIVGMIWMGAVDEVGVIVHGATLVGNGGASLG